MLTYRVVVSTLAKYDLQNIVTYIESVESVGRAKYVEQNILSEMKRIVRFPTAYPKDEYASTDDKTIRYTVKWNYKILFYIEANVIQVVGIFHTAQSPEKLIDYNR